MAAIGADPHWDRGAPVTLATNRPVLDVREPLSHSLATGPLRSPLDLGVVLQYLVANRGHADKPAVHRVVQQRMVGTPAVRVVVSVCVLAVQHPLVREIVYDVRIAVLDVAPVEHIMGPRDEVAVNPHGVLGREANLHAEVVILLAVHHCRVDYSCAVRGSDEVRLNHGPSTLRFPSIYCTGEQGLVGLANQCRSRKFFNHLDLVPQYIREQVFG